MARTTTLLTASSLGMSSQEIKALADEDVICITTCDMFMETRYTYLEHRPDKRPQELCIRGTGVRTSTIWHDR